MVVHVTETGWAVGALCIGGWALVALGWAEAGVIAVGCSVLLVATLGFLLRRPRLTVTVVVSPPRVTAGEPLAGVLRAHNRRHSTAASATIDLPVGDGGVTYGVPRIGPGQVHDEHFVVPTERRGVIAVGPARAVAGDPLGLVARQQTASEAVEVAVHPRVVPLEPFGLGLLRDLDGTTRDATSVSDLAFHALRAYLPGDDMRHVHWRSSARHGQLLVRQFLDTRRSHLAVVVDSDATAYASEEEYEAGVSVAASLLRRAILDDYDVSLQSGDVWHVGSASGAWWQALDACSRLQPSGHELVDVAARAGRMAPGISLVVLVAGSSTAPLRLLRAAGAFSAQAAACGVRLDASQPAGLGAIADLPMLTVPGPGELGRALAAGMR